ncbi:MAG: hypothetical protein ACKO3W_03570 [bacterium]
MKPTEKFAPYRKSAFLSTVAAADRALANRLCALLEAAFGVKDIKIYAGFPIVVRDMEWIAGFAMRKNGPIAYCCSPATLAAMGAELKPYMSGKSCIAVKPRKGETIDDVLALVGRAFQQASKSGGMICKADRRKRDRARAEASKRLAAEKKSPSKKVVTKQVGTRKTASKASRRTK